MGITKFEAYAPDWEEIVSIIASLDQPLCVIYVIRIRFFLAQFSLGAPVI
jgi:hypothetical protein